MTRLIGHRRLAHEQVEDKHQSSAARKGKEKTLPTPISHAQLPKLFPPRLTRKAIGCRLYSLTGPSNYPKHSVKRMTKKDASQWKMSSYPHACGPPATRLRSYACLIENRMVGFARSAASRGVPNTVGRVSCQFSPASRCGVHRYIETLRSIIVAAFPWELAVFVITLCYQADSAVLLGQA